MIFTAFILTAQAQVTDVSTPTRLLQYCPIVNDNEGSISSGTTGGYDTWSNVPSSEWYWEDDWDEWDANNTSPITRLDGQVYPAGFRPYELGQYSEPPICMLVGGSSDKKIEVLMESPLENANLCIRDAAPSGAGNNDVGNIENCGSGKIYACFTAATANAADFGFYVTCEEGCEDMIVDVWIRVRISEKSWDEGKTNTTDDLEHWCEGERGTHFDSDDLDSPLYYTYPSDLIPDEPSEYPFHIHQIFGNNAGSLTGPNIWLIVGLALGIACLLA